jgi:hypothetical protein
MRAGHADLFPPREASGTLRGDVRHAAGTRIASNAMWLSWFTK